MDIHELESKIHSMVDDLGTTYLWKEIEGYEECDEGENNGKGTCSANCRVVVN